MKFTQIDYLLLECLVNNKSGKLTKLTDNRMKYLTTNQNFVGFGKIYLSPWNGSVFLHCGSEIRTSPIKHINKIVQDNFGISIIIETMNSTYEIFINA